MSNLSKKQILIIIAVGILFVVIIGGYLYSVYSSGNNEDVYDNLILSSNYEQNSIESGKVVVHIAGEVNKPGIIEVDNGARIADIVEKADGFTDEADISKLNLAYVVQDGQKIIIPNLNDEAENEVEEDNGDLIDITKENGKGVIEEETKEDNIVGIININKATQTQLEQLPGIGPSTALKIIEHRKTNGKFNKIEDIKNVKGIGDGKFDKIKEYITI